MNNDEKILRWMFEGNKIAKSEGYDGKFMAWMAYSSYALENGASESFISPKSFKDEMMELKDMFNNDRETMHREADRLMCAVLVSFGYKEGVEVFESMRKWYA